MSDRNKRRASTTTQIRNFYSEGNSYISVKFYNMNLSMSIYPFQNYQENGLSKYSKESIFMNLNPEDAYAIYEFCKKVLDKQITEGEITTKSFTGVVMTIRRVPVDNVYETIITITEVDRTVKFIFATREYKKKVNGVEVVERMDSQLGIFVKTIEGYLTGINSERHLNKFTEDYVASLPQSERGQQGAGSGYDPQNAGQWQRSYQESHSRNQNRSNGGWNGNNRNQNNNWNNNGYRRNNQNQQQSRPPQNSGWN